jgi:hypothetical protein
MKRRRREGCGTIRLRFESVKLQNTRLEFITSCLRYMELMEWCIFGTSTGLVRG